MHFNDRDSIIALTPLWKGERLPDGRPKVPDKYLDALYGMTLEEVWKPIFVLGYEHQFVGGGENPMHTSRRTLKIPLTYTKKSDQVQILCKAFGYLLIFLHS